MVRMISSVSLELMQIGKASIEITSRAPITSREELALAYTPGVAQPCLEIQKDPALSYHLWPFPISRKKMTGIQGDASPWRRLGGGALEVLNPGGIARKIGHTTTPYLSLFLVVSVLMYAIYKAVPGDPVALMLDSSKKQMDPARYEQLYEQTRERGVSGI